MDIEICGNIYDEKTISDMHSLSDNAMERGYIFWVRNSEGYIMGAWMTVHVTECMKYCWMIEKYLILSRRSGNAAHGIFIREMEKVYKWI